MIRRKRSVVLFLALTLVLSMTLTGCKGKEAGPEVEETTIEGSLTDGTYMSKGPGYGGEMTVETTIKDGKIENVVVTEQAESSPVYNRALPVITERIIEAQSPIVDSVSGASFTSFGIKKAVAESLKEAGQDFGDINFATGLERGEKKEAEAVKTDLVVVGGGPSGLAAAITAKQSGVENVIVVEKLDILSGNGKFDMNFFDMINSKALKETGNDMTVEEFIESKESAFDSEERVKVWAENAAELDEWLRDMNVELNYNYGGTSHMAETDAYAGEHIQDNLELKAKELGIDIRTGTKGLDIIMDGEKATGVKVENRDEFYDINADAVIIATGGFSTNKEYLAKYAPGAERVETSNQMGTTGDFIPVFEKHNLKMDQMDTLSVFKLIIKNRRDLTGAGDGFLLVNKDGQRFAAENSSGLPLAHAILDQADGKVFYIYDQPLYESFYRLQKHNELGYHEKADTLEELAGKLEISPENLVESVETYNKAINKEIEDPFRGEEVFDRPFAENGPYYGVQVESAIHMTKGGVVANEKAQILTNDNVPVEGLYASGEVTATAGAYSASVAFGRVAGKEAAKQILNK